MNLFYLTYILGFALTFSSYGVVNASNPRFNPPVMWTLYKDKQWCDNFRGRRINGNRAQGLTKK